MNPLRFIWGRLSTPLHLLKEPSTHAGIAAALAGFAQFNPTLCWLAALEGVVAVLLKEGAAKPAAE